MDLGDEKRSAEARPLRSVACACLPFGCAIHRNHPTYRSAHSNCIEAPPHLLRSRAIRPLPSRRGTRAGARPDLIRRRSRKPLWLPTLAARPLFSTHGSGGMVASKTLRTRRSHNTGEFFGRTASTARYRGVISLKNGLMPMRRIGEFHLSRRTICQPDFSSSHSNCQSSNSWK